MRFYTQGPNSSPSAPPVLTQYLVFFGTKTTQFCPFPNFVFFILPKSPLFP